MGQPLNIMDQIDNIVASINSSIAELMTIDTTVNGLGAIVVSMLYVMRIIMYFCLLVDNQIVFFIVCFYCIVVIILNNKRYDIKRILYNCNNYLGYSGCQCTTT